MLFSACYALSAVLGLIMLTAPAALAEIDWAITTMPPTDELCSGEICVEEYEESPCALLPELCRPSEAEEKRASSFSSWGGKRVPFSTWGGKRGAPFSTWGGKRVPFSTWGGKRTPGAPGAADKKANNFNAWGGKRVAFSSWGGKRSSPFSTWGGKREEPGVFSAWGGKRDLAGRDKRAAAAAGGKRQGEGPGKGAAIRRGGDFYPWGGKRASLTPQ